jgi:uncharacterized protein (DUF3820 family)
MSAKLTFGKYKGDTLSQIAKDDGKYLIWVVKQDFVDKSMKKAIAGVLDTIKLDFGRHAGKTIGYVKKNDPKYYRWLLKPAPEVKPIEDED